MKSFGFIILFALISFVLSISGEMKCKRIKDEKLECCWENSNSCCELPKKDEMCADSITTCCKIYEGEEANKMEKLNSMKNYSTKNLYFIILFFILI